MKIYDCFTFFNELDLLELRLKILDSVVDYFVIVEAVKTHAGKSKPLFFEENKKKFKRWEKKIIHIIVEDLPKPGKIFFKNWKINSVLGLGRWRPEIYQRNQIGKGLKNCKKEDIIIVSDLDEIPNPKKFKELKENSKRGKISLFNQNLSYYFLNGFANSGWQGSRACNFKVFKGDFGGKADRLRRIRGFKLRFEMHILRNRKNLKAIKKGGWHFSYLGDIKSIIQKISSTSHSELDKIENKSSEKIKESIKKGEDLYGRGLKIKYIPIDNSFPEEIRRNKKKYSKFIKK